MRARVYLGIDLDLLDNCFNMTFVFIGNQALLHLEYSLRNSERKSLTIHLMRTLDVGIRISMLMKESGTEYRCKRTQALREINIWARVEDPRGRLTQRVVCFAIQRPPVLDLGQFGVLLSLTR